LKAGIGYQDFWEILLPKESALMIRGYYERLKDEYGYSRELRELLRLNVWVGIRANSKKGQGPRKPQNVMRFMDEVDEKQKSIKTDNKNRNPFADDKLIKLMEKRLKRNEKAGGFVDAGVLV